MNDISKSNISYTVIKEQTELMDEINNTHPTQLVFVNECNGCGKTSLQIGYDMEILISGVMLCDDCRLQDGGVQCEECQTWFKECIVDRRTLYGKKLWACFSMNGQKITKQANTKSGLWCDKCAHDKGYDD